MSEIHTNFHTLITHASHSLSKYFQIPIHFSKIIQLNEADRRNNILRLLIDNPTHNVPSSFILKNTLLEKNVFESSKAAETVEEQFNRFAHDWAGLEFLTSIGNH